MREPRPGSRTSGSSARLLHRPSPRPHRFGRPVVTGSTGSRSRTRARAHSSRVATRSFTYLFETPAPWSADAYGIAILQVFS